MPTHLHPSRSRSHTLILIVAAALLAASLLLAATARAQGRASSTPIGAPPLPSSAQPVPEAPQAGSPTVFPHSHSGRYFLAGQANIIFQGHGPFHSPYQGTNSLLSRGEYKTSMVGTIFAGLELRRNPNTHTEVLYDEEEASGRGISEALGLAGFTNLDVVRNPNLGPLPYLARVELHQTFGLTRTLVDSARGPFSLATQVPERRIEFRIGKMGLPDTFDINSVGTDSHLQFLNWTIDNNGAWDYAADTRGYTWGAIAEYDQRGWSVRYGIALMPTVANGIQLDWSLRRASGQNIEVEWRHSLLPGVSSNRKGAVRALSFVNRAHMGLYRAANRAYLEGVDPTPTITAHATYGAVKYGFGLNAEQELTPALRIYTRLGWNEGQHESYAYTEVDQTLAGGADLTGQSWGRPLDRTGAAFVSNAIKRDHQAYLALGGLGFILGDGRLHYAREDILETYYTMHTWRGLYYALDAQYITHPGYNQDRGPVLVEALRMHVDF